MMTWCDIHMLAFGSVTLTPWNIAFVAGVLIVGLAAAWWVFVSSRKTGGSSSREARRGTSTSDRAMMAIGQIRDVANGVARDVDSHSTAVGKMSAELAILNSSGGSASTESVVGIIAKVLQANERLQSQLAAAELKLEAKEEEIARHQNAARTDSLTGLPNRRALDHEIARRFAEWQRKGTPFGIVMIDVDGFKEFNNRYGHQAGDEVLRQIGRSLSESTREMDLPCRYGGEEFVVVVPASTLTAAARTAERARTAIEKLRVRWQDDSLNVTVSYGVAQVLEGDDAVSVVQRADEALYCSKGSGRNRGYLHDGIECRPATPGVRPSTAPRPRPRSPEARLLFTLPDGQQLEQELHRRTSESCRYGLPLSLMYVEVMDFARLAAAHEQRTVDLVLDAVAQKLEATIRQRDFLAYEDNGRFAIILPGSTEVEASQIAKRIQVTQAHESVTVGAVEVEIALTIGVGSRQQDDSTASLRARAIASLRERALAPMPS